MCVLVPAGRNNNNYILCYVYSWAYLYLCFILYVFSYVRLYPGEDLFFLYYME